MPWLPCMMWTASRAFLIAPVIVLQFGDSDDEGVGSPDLTDQPVQRFRLPSRQAEYPRCIRKVERADSRRRRFPHRPASAAQSSCHDPVAGDDANTATETPNADAENAKAVAAEGFWLLNHELPPIPISREVTRELIVNRVYDTREK